MISGTGPEIRAVKPDGTRASAFFRAMARARLGRTEEARRLAAQAAAKMTPLPTGDEATGLRTTSHDDLILWMAYKEARELIGFDPPPATQPATRPATRPEGP